MSRIVVDVRLAGGPVTVAVGSDPVQLASRSVELESPGGVLVLRPHEAQELGWALRSLALAASEGSASVRRVLAPVEARRLVGAADDREGRPA